MSAISALGLERSLGAKTGKADFLTDLVRSLDTLIFIEIAILYCCDNLTLLLILRAVSQVLYVQVRPAPFATPTQLPPVLIANLVCFGTHLLHSRPEATGRSSRGYLHGGLIIDFVGELGKITKWRLATLDLCIFALQILMLAIEHKRQGLYENAGVEDVSAAPTQDIEAEEAGIRRSEEGVAETEHADTEGMEMQRLLSDGTAVASNNPAREPLDDEFILELDVRQSLRALVKRSSAVEATGAASSQAASIGTILGRIAAARAGPDR